MIIKYTQLQEMDAAWHDAAGAFQRLGCAQDAIDASAAYAAFQRAQDRYKAAKEGRVEDVPPDVIRVRDGWDANGGEVEL